MGDMADWVNDDTLGMHRRDDHPTSVEAARAVAVRAGSQKARLLEAYGAAGGEGLTDEEAGEVTGLADVRSCCYWKRCSELRAAGFIVDSGRVRASSAGLYQMVCTVTGAGRSA